MNLEKTKLEIIEAVMKIDDAKRLAFFLKVIDQERKMPNITRAFYDMMIQELSQVVQSPVDIEEYPIDAWEETRAQLFTKG